MAGIGAELAKELIKLPFHIAYGIYEEHKKAEEEKKQEAAFFDAVIKGNLPETIRLFQLLKKQYNFNIRSHTNLYVGKPTALYLAAQYGHVHIIKFILDNGSDSDFDGAMRPDVDIDTCYKYLHSNECRLISSSTKPKLNPQQFKKQVIIKVQDELLDTHVYYYANPAMPTFKKIIRSTDFDSFAFPSMQATEKQLGKTPECELTSQMWKDIKYSKESSLNSEITVAGFLCYSPWNTPLWIAAKNNRVDVINFWKDSVSLDNHGEGGMSPLAVATLHGHKNAVKAILSFKSAKGACCFKDDRGCIPLHLAAQAGFVEILQLLIGKEKDRVINKKNKDGSTPLHFATAHKSTQCMQLLIDEGANINVIDNDGRTPLTLAVSMGDENCIKLLIASKGINLGLVSPEYIPPMHVAIKENKLKIAELLLKAGVSVDQIDQEGKTPLMLAASEGDVNKLQFLIQHGATINQADKNGLTALHYAILADDLRAISLLIKEKADVNYSHDVIGGISPLCFAVKHNKINAMLVLSGLGAETKSRAKDKWAALSPLKIAVFENNKKAISELVKSGADIQERDKQGSLLEVSLFLRDEDTQESDFEISQYLIELGANPNEVTELGEPLIYKAAQSGNLDTVQFLIKAKANLQKVTPNRCTALHVATEKGYSHIMTALILAQADVNAEDAIGQTALYYAIRGNQPMVIKPLVDAKIKLENKDQNGETALHEAARCGNLPCLNALMNAKADIHATNTDGMTPLHLTFIHGHLSCAEELIKRGAQIWQKDNVGQIAFGLACVHGHLDMIDFFISNKKLQKEIDIPYFQSLYKNKKEDASSRVQLTLSVKKSAIKLILSQLQEYEAKDGKAGLFYKPQNSHIQAIQVLKKSLDEAMNKEERTVVDILKLLDDTQKSIVDNKSQKTKGYKPSALYCTLEQSSHRVIKTSGVIESILGIGCLGLDKYLSSSTQQPGPGFFEKSQKEDVLITAEDNNNHKGKEEDVDNGALSTSYNALK